MPENHPNSNIWLAGAAEVVGTFVLVFAGTAVVSTAALGLPIAGPALNSLSIGLTFGLVLVALVAALAHVSGAHLNPAVTLGLASIGRFPWKFVPIYIVAQFIGAILAGLAVWGTLGDAARTKAALGATFPAPGVDGGAAFLMEFLITFILVFVIVAVDTDERANTAAAAAAIGFALAVAVLIGGPVTGGAANPARAIGPMIAAAKFNYVWVYLIAPPVGGIVAALLYKHVLGKTSPPPPEEVTTVVGRAGRP